MTEAAVAGASSRVLAALVRATDAVARHVVVALGAILAFQIGATVLLFFSVNGHAQFWEPWTWPLGIRYGRLFNRIE